jgi:hypothetical protein
VGIRLRSSSARTIRGFDRACWQMGSGLISVRAGAASVLSRRPVLQLMVTGLDVCKQPKKIFANGSVRSRRLGQKDDALRDRNPRAEPV